MRHIFSETESWIEDYKKELLENQARELNKYIRDEGPLTVLDQLGWCTETAGGGSYGNTDQTRTTSSLQCEWEEAGRSAAMMFGSRPGTQKQWGREKTCIRAWSDRPSNLCFNQWKQLSQTSRWLASQYMKASSVACFISFFPIKSSNKSKH